MSLLLIGLTDPHNQSTQLIQPLKSHLVIRQDQLQIRCFIVNSILSCMREREAIESPQQLSTFKTVTYKQCFCLATIECSLGVIKLQYLVAIEFYTDPA